MIGIFEQTALVFRSKAHGTLDKYEDPHETLNYSYEHQLESLRKVCRGVADVATSRKRVELQAQKMSSEIDRYTVATQCALEFNREDLAREALTRKTGLAIQLQDLRNQHAALQAGEGKLVHVSTRLQAEMDASRTHKETIRVTHSAAEAWTRISEAFIDISEEMSDTGTAIQHAEDKTLQLQIRASAVNELPAPGAPEDPTGSVGNDLGRKLDALASKSPVENEPATVKAQLSGGLNTTDSQIPSIPTPNLPMIEDTRTTNSNEGQT